MARTGALALLLLGSHTAWAQYVVGAQAGTIHHIEGEVSVDGQSVRATPPKFPVLQEGQMLRTGIGRAEVLLGSGVFLRLGDRGALRMLNTLLENTEVEVLQGTALVEVVAMPIGSDVHVVVGATRTGFKGIGLHRFEAESNELLVFGGHAEVFAADQTLEAGRGTVVHLGDTLSVSKFDTRRKDALHQWAARRSFLLYSSNPLAHFRITNWEVTMVTPADNKAVVFSRDFGVTFTSP